MIPLHVPCTGLNERPRAEKPFAKSGIDFNLITLEPIHVALSAYRHRSR